YPWVPPLGDRPPAEAARIEQTRAWLDLPFFVGRSLLWVGCWAAFASLLARWSLAQDEASGAALQARMHRLGAAALPVLALTTTLASFDWLMSLQPAWVSTIFGIYWFSGG